MVSENLGLWSGFLQVHTTVCVQKAVYLTSVSILNTWKKKNSEPTPLPPRPPKTKDTHHLESKVKFLHDESHIFPFN